MITDYNLKHSKRKFKTQHTSSNSNIRMQAYNIQIQVQDLTYKFKNAKHLFKNAKFKFNTQHISIISSRPNIRSWNTLKPIKARLTCIKIH